MIRKSLVLTLAMAMLAMCFITCQKDQATPETPSAYAPLDGRQVTEAMLSQALQVFGVDALKEGIALEDAGNNVSISPLSLAAALYMVYNGARGKTKEAMEDALRLEQGLDPTQLNTAYRTLLSTLDPRDASIELQLAHAVFWDEWRMFPHDAFLTIMHETFSAATESFSFAEPSAVETINDWVNTNTNGRIEKVIDALDPAEVMFILNALYFKGDWLESFPEEQTSSSEFHLRDGTATEVDMMQADRDVLRYDGSNFTAIELPLKDTSYVMTFIVSSNSGTIDDVVQDLSSGMLKEIDDHVKRARVLLYLPRFEVEYKVSANQMLKNMGMSIAFSGSKADLRNLGYAPEGNLYINRVVHKTYLKIDERGVEGAAVTGVGIGVTSLPPTIRFDHPFVFLLRHKPSKAILFAGKIEDPSI
jgi:serine protease inhibitor